MKLSSATPQHVVRNAKNGSHYRFESIVDGRARIFPLELFPNGLLISKPTPTTVPADIEVIAIGPWSEDMVVEGKPDKARAKYERELVEAQAALIELEAAYELLPVSGTGHESRGSWANKVKNKRMRIAVLRRGLGFVDAALTRQAPIDEAPVQFSTDQLVQVPSGRVAKVQGFKKVGDKTYVQVKTLFKGAVIQAALPAEVLRCASRSRIVSV